MSEETAALPASTPEPAKAPSRRAVRKAARRTRTTSLRVSRVSPWGVLINSLFFSVVLACVVEGLLYFTWKLFDSYGVFDAVINAISPSGGEGAETLERWTSLNTFLSIGSVFAVSLVIIIPLFCFFAAAVYNLTSRLTGGVRVTFMGDAEAQA